MTGVRAHLTVPITSSQLLKGPPHTCVNYTENKVTRTCGVCDERTYAQRSTPLLRFHAALATDLLLFHITAATHAPPPPNCRCNDDYNNNHNRFDGYHPNGSNKRTLIIHGNYIYSPNSDISYRF